MTPIEFKEQLIRSFHLNLTPNEISSLVYYFTTEDHSNNNNQNNSNNNNNNNNIENNNERSDNRSDERNNDESNENKNHHNNNNNSNSDVIHFNSNQSINCNTFLKLFYRISYNEKQNSFHNNISQVNKINKKKEERAKNIEKKFQYLTEVELKPIKKNTKENVIKKLEIISKEYNKKNITKEFNSILKVFQSKKISIKHFNEIMKNYFLIHFNGSELTVLYEMFGDFHSSTSSTSLTISHSRSEIGGRLSSNYHNNSSLDLTSSDLLFYNENNYNFESNGLATDSVYHEEGFGDGEEIEREAQEGIERLSHHLDTQEVKYINCKSFLRYFCQSTKIDKDNFVQKKNYISNRIQRIKQEYEIELEKKLLDRKSTKVTYPNVPDVNLSADLNIQIQSQPSSQFENNNYKNNNSNERSIDNMLFLEDSVVDSSEQQKQQQQQQQQQLINSKRKKTRKLSVLDTISPNRHVLKLFKNEKSLVNLYPSASEDTKVTSFFKSFIPSNRIYLLINFLI